MEQLYERCAFFRLRCAQAMVSEQLVSPKFGFGCVSEPSFGNYPSVDRAGPTCRTPPGVRLAAQLEATSQRLLRSRPVRGEREVLDVIEAVC